MKSFLIGLLKGRKFRFGVLAVVLAAAGLSIAWLGPEHYRLGGAWIGGTSGHPQWNCLQIPLDPAGQTEALRVSLVGWGPEFAGLLSAFGANTVTDGVGEGRMISQDTAQWSFVCYAQVAGNPPVKTAILVYSGTFKFTGQDTAALVYTLRVYLASADADGDGYPDAGVLPVLTIPDIPDSAKRVPWK